MKRCVTQTAPRTRWSAPGPHAGHRQLPEETPIALVHDASTTAVMMGTPADLEDFAVGFTLTEGLATGLNDIREVEIVDTDLGIEARVWLAAGAGAALIARRRRLAGPTGCGLCGIDSLGQAVRAIPRVGCGLRMKPQDISNALAALAPAQALGAATRAVHAAAWWRPEDGLAAVREDVGRHNALDKLVGALTRREVAAGDGPLLLTSRVSVEMVQKAAVLGAQIVAAVSAPTALAVRVADAAGMTLAAVARADGFEVFTHPERFASGAAGLETQ